MSLTEDQHKAVFHENRDMLVAANAGSGKTKVLIDRIIRIMLGGKTDVLHLFVSTFTNAASAGMKLKLQDKLNEVLKSGQFEGKTLKEPAKHFLRQQVSLVGAASVMTLDAFALQVVKRYYYVAGIAPNFRLLTDDIERQALEEDVWQQVVEASLGDAALAPQFEALLENYGGVDGLGGIVKACLNYVMTLADGDAWLAALPEDYDPDGFNQWATDTFLPAAQPELRPIMRELQAALEVIGGDDGDDTGRTAIDTLREAVGTPLSGIQAAAEATTYGAFVGALADVKWPSMPSRVKAEFADLKEKVKGPHDTAKAAFTDWQKTLGTLLPTIDLAVQLPRAHQLVVALVATIQRYKQSLAKAKQAKRVMTFTDVAQTALALLNQIDPVTNQPVKLAYQEQFHEVLIDEYQDINALQEALITAISRQNPGNRFMVGDVKQSIYGFRLADPKLFLQKAETFQPNSEVQERVMLAENFRSMRPILSFSNLVFRQIMDHDVGEMAYGQDTFLKYGNDKYPEPSAMVPTILLNDLGKPAADAVPSEETDEDTEEDYAAEEGEAWIMAKQIAKLVADQTPIFDPDPDVKENCRPIRYSDITLLTRTKSHNVTMQQVFKEAGVPLSVEKAKNYFKTTELSLMNSLLQLVVNFKQDIPLAAVLRSPLVGLTADQMATIRKQHREGFYYQAVLAYPETKDPNPAIIAALTDLRELLTLIADYAAEHPLADVIWFIYEQTGYLDYVAAMPSGAQRQANLRDLAERAAGFEQTGSKGLYAFITYVQTLIKRDQDVDQAVAENQADTVSLMTIHTSKGLEFPVVFLFGLGRRFNLKDTTSQLIQTRHGVGTNIIDATNHVRYPLPQWLMAKKAKKAQQLAEEMRLLYVALTRAEQGLYLVGSVNDANKSLAKWAQTVDNQMVIPASSRSKALSYLDWIGPSLVRHPDFAKRTWLSSNEEADLEEPAAHVDLSEATGPAEFNLVVLQPSKTSSQAPDKAVTQPPLDLDLDDWLNFSYPYQAATKTASFQTATEIKRAFDDPTTVELANSDRQIGGHRYQSDLAVPSFLDQKQQAGGAKTGTATHLLLQQLPLTAATDPKATLTNLVSDGQIEPELAKRINLEAVSRFLSAPLGQQMVQAGNKVQREVPFSLLLPAERLFPDMAGDDQDVLVHGVMDAYFETEAGMVLVDYKTDHIPSKGSASVVNRYRGQLNLYATALSAMTNQPVAHQYLVLLQSGEVVDLVAKP